MFGNAISGGDTRNDSIGFLEELFGIFHGLAFRLQLLQVGSFKKHKLCLAGLTNCKKHCQWQYPSQLNGFSPRANDRVKYRNSRQ